MDYINNSLFGKDSLYSSSSNVASSVAETASNFSSHLIEPNIKYILYSTLRKCHDYRASVYNLVFNLGIFIAFVLVFGGSLYYCYKKKPTPQERHERMMRDQNYILSKIRFYQNEKLKEREQSSATNITNLPIHPQYGHF